MPSGITSVIQKRDDVSLEEFLIRCARQFGAFIHMKDDPLDKPYELAKVDPYYKNQLEKAKTRLIEYQTMTIEEAAEIAEEDYNSAVKEREQSRKNKEILRAKYENLLKQVENWEVPTQDHENLKKYAIDQLTESMKWDCQVYGDDPVRIPPEEIIELWIEKVEEDIAYYRKNYEKEKIRVKERNQWVTDLINSFKSE